MPNQDIVMVSGAGVQRKRNSGGVEPSLPRNNCRQGEIPARSD